uniref:Ground-like domain-containing protein n=1 Tax=Panagrolaimus sp. ES5 TaxID=591445 RepID=A0AC34FPS6_9BILA
MKHQREIYQNEKTRERKFQLSTGAISITAAPQIRKKRQDYGRNPPSSNFESQNQQPSQPPQLLSSLQQRPAQTFQSNVQPPVRNTVISQQTQQPASPPPTQRIQPFRNNQQQQPSAAANNNNNLPPSTSPRRQPAGRRSGQRQRQPPPQADPPQGQQGNMASGDVKAARYYYPPRMPLPLPVCFYNPTGYVCCNKQLNDLIVDTYTELEARPKFHTCNINAIATMLQMKAETRFNTTFETIAGFEDFAQKIHFNGDLACKVEIGGKYMLAYGTVEDADQHLPPEDEMGPQNEVPRHHISKRHSAFF